MSKDYFFDNDGDFDALSLVKIAWEQKIPLILLSFFTAIGAAFYTQFLDEKWIATTTLMPVEAAEAGPAGAGASALVGLVGIIVFSIVCKCDYLYCSVLELKLVKINNQILVKIYLIVLTS